MVGVVGVVVDRCRSLYRQCSGRGGGGGLLQLLFELLALAALLLEVLLQVLQLQLHPARVRVDGRGWVG
jgi:hypothetical protein